MEVKRGYVARLRRDRGFGFIREGEVDGRGQEYFFHRKDCDVMSPFHTLSEGDKVEFAGQMSDRGLRAEDVRLG